MIGQPTSIQQDEVGKLVDELCRALEFVRKEQEEKGVQLDRTCLLRMRKLLMLIANVGQINYLEEEHW
jgi:hypothetical protein